MRCEEQRLPDVQYSWQDCEAMCCAAMPIICVMQAEADGTDAAAAIAGYFVGLVHQIQSLGLITGCRRQGHAASSLHRPPDYDENEEESEEWRELASTKAITHRNASMGSILTWTVRAVRIVPGSVAPGTTLPACVPAGSRTSIS